MRLTLLLLRAALRLACALLLVARPAFARPAAPPPLQCVVDPVVELLSVIVLFGHPDRQQLDHAYARDARAHFAALRDHPAVRRGRAISGRGFDDFVAQLSTRVGPPPALVQRGRIPSVGDGPHEISADTLRGLLVEARDFARRGDFAAFYARHAPLYQRLCDRVLADTSLAGTAAQTEAFFGTRAAGYRLVLMPLVPRLGVAPPGVRAAPNVTLTAFLGPAGTRDDEPWFRTGWSIQRVVLHEFAHQHVNGAVYPAIGALRRSSRLLAPMRGRLWRADHIVSWPGAVTETVVRAAVALMRGESAGEEAARAELREQRAFGFALIDTVVAAMRAARRAPPNGAAGPWWPRGMRAVVAALDRVAASPRAGELADPPFDAGMAQAIIASAPDSVLIILPTEESDSALQDSLRGHITRMRDRYLPRARIVSDREALARDLRGWTPWAIGTANRDAYGNAWLRAHAAAVPARVDSAAIVTDSTYVGRTLVFVGAVPSPVDRRRALLMTVGQRVEDLARGWWIFSADYAVVDGARVLTRGLYESTGRKFVPATDTTGTP